MGSEAATRTLSGQLEKVAESRAGSFGLRIVPWLLPSLAVLGPYASFVPGSAGFPYFYRLVMLVTVPLAVVVWLTNEKLRRDNLTRIFTALTFLWPFWTLLSVSWSPAGAAGLRQSFASSIALLAAWAAFVIAVATPGGLARFQRGWLGALVLLIAISVIEVLTGKHLLSEVAGIRWTFRKDQISATAANPNGLAMMVLALLAILLAYVLVAKLNRTILICAVGALFSAYVVLATDSRFGLLGICFLLAGSTVLFIIRRAGWVKVITVVLVLAATLAGNALGVGQIRGSHASAVISSNPDTTRNPENRVRTPAEVQAADGRSERIRVQLTKAGIRYFVQSPIIGHGAGAVPKLIDEDPKVGQLPRYPLHNSLLQIGVEFGLILLVPTLLFLGLVTVRLFRSGGRRRIVGRAEGLAVLGAVGLASVTLSIMYTEPTYWLLLGYVASIAYVSKTAGSSDVEPGLVHQ